MKSNEYIYQCDLLSVSERNDTYKKSREFLKILAFQSEGLIRRFNELNEVRNYRYAKTFDEKYWHFENRIKHGISYKLISCWK